jgi:hypothetical protein
MNYVPKMMNVPFSLVILCTMVMSTMLKSNVIEGFSPRDNVSNNTPAATAHIGKPPPFRPSQRRTSVASTASLPNTNRNHRHISVIGKAPKGVAYQQYSSSQQIDHIRRHSTKSNPLVVLAMEDTIEISRHPDSICISTGMGISDVERNLLEHEAEYERFLGDHIYESHGSETLQIILTHKNDNDDSEVIVPTVQAIFCGYTATLEEINRLRSARVDV